MMQVLTISIVNIIKQNDRDCRVISVVPVEIFSIYCMKLLHTSTCSAEYLVTINDEDTVLVNNLLNGRSSYLAVIYRRDASARWNRPSGSPPKSLSTITLMRGFTMSLPAHSV